MEDFTIAIFASGSGSNAQRIIEYFRENGLSASFIILSNKKEAFVHERAKTLGVPSFYFSKRQFNEGNEVLDLLKKQEVKLVVLAGFLLLVPKNLLEAYPQKVINIHPALLPKFGGKGMYGHHVHEAVIAAQEKESGITIHFCNAQYDEGDVILQKSCPVLPNDTPGNLVKRIHRLEHEWYPKVVEELFNEMKK